MNKKAILFDLDGTLLDTATDLIDAFNELLRRYNREEVSLAEMRHLLTRGSRFFITQFFNQNATETEIAQLRAEFLDIYSNNAHQTTKLYPGMLEVLEHINIQQMPWGIVTNKLTQHTHENLTLLSLPSQPQVIVCGDTLTVAKPNPEPLWHACEKLKLATHEVIYVGDSDVDAEAGMRAKIDTIIVAHGYNSGKAQFDQLNIIEFIHEPKEILRFLINFNT